MQRFVLTQQNKEILAEYAKSEEPNESCAILFGEGNKVSEIFLTQNTEKSPVSFTIASEQLIKAYTIAEEKKIEVIGIFHSHPNSEAYPSSTDKKFMQINPVTWIIYSGINRDFKAYILESDIVEIPINEE